MVTANDLAKLILQMNYGQLKMVGDAFAAACEDKESRPQLETGEEFADLIYDWAEAEATAGSD